jgi:hypothetical protein
MTNEERNKTMDGLFKTLDYWRPAVKSHHISDEIEAAIRRLDAKARAWDKLTVSLPSSDVIAEGGSRNERNARISGFKVAIQAVQKLMTDLLDPPKPKSKLERLKEMALEHAKLWTPPKCVDLDALLADIDRLEGEDGQT